MTNETQRIEHRGWRIPFGFFAGPLLYGLQLLVGYGLATVACAINNKWPVYALIGLSALIVLAAALVAHNSWHAWPGSERSIFLEADQSHDTTTFLAVSGFVISLLFFLLILATLIIDVFSSSCPVITMPLP
jgi:hypothetical protein